MSMSPEQIAALSGSNAYKGGHTGGSYYDTITLGKDGKFYLAHYSQPKDKREDPSCLGESVEVVIVKIRGKLTRWENNVQTLTSVEYDAGTDVIATTVGDMSEKDAKGMGAKKAVVLYVLRDGAIAKMTVSGGSLYNPEDTESLRLYSYLQSFEGDDHTFMYKTIVTAKEVQYEYDGEAKTTYHMTFTKGAENTPVELGAVGESLTVLVEELVDADARDLKFLGFDNTAKATSAGSDDEEPF